MPYSILDTEEYKNIMSTAMGIVLIPTDWFNGVYAYDKVSRITFEFACLAHAMGIEYKEFIIFCDKKVYTYDEKTESYEINRSLDGTTLVELSKYVDILF